LSPSFDLELKRQQLQIPFGEAVSNGIGLRSEKERIMRMSSVIDAIF